MKLLVFDVLLRIMSHLGGSGVNFTPEQLYNKQLSSVIWFRTTSILLSSMSVMLLSSLLSPKQQCLIISYDETLTL